MNDPIFLNSYVKGPIFLTSWYMHIICFAQGFFEAACSLGIQWANWYLSNNQQKMGTKKSKGSIWIGQHFGWSSIRMGPFFSKARYMNGVGFEILARTSVTKLPLGYPFPPPPPHRPPPPLTPHRGNWQTLQIQIRRRSEYGKYSRLFLSPITDLQIW